MYRSIQQIYIDKYFVKNIICDNKIKTSISVIRSRRWSKPIEIDNFSLDFYDPNLVKKLDKLSILL